MAKLYTFSSRNTRTMSEISSLIEQKMQATIDASVARDCMEQARQAMEHHERRVEFLTQEIARVSLRDVQHD